MEVVLAYADNDLIDTKPSVVVDVQATPARWSAEVDATKTMLQRAQDRLGLQPCQRAPKLPTILPVSPRGEWDIGPGRYQPLPGP